MFTDIRQTVSGAWLHVAPCGVANVDRDFRQQQVAGEHNNNGALEISAGSTETKFFGHFFLPSPFLRGVKTSIFFVIQAVIHRKQLTL